MKRQTCTVDAPITAAGAGAPAGLSERTIAATLADGRPPGDTWPQGWTPRTTDDRHHLTPLIGCRRLTIVNLGQVKTRIAQQAFRGHPGDPTAHADP